MNPWAGVGGPAALRGSDGAAIVAAALERGSRPLANARAHEALRAAGDIAAADWFAFAGDMGEGVLREFGVAPQLLGEAATEPSTAADTQRAVQAVLAQGVDLLLFAGGDGTARDVVAAADRPQLSLGIPAGVKMQSGVFAATPHAAGVVLHRLLTGDLLEVRDGEVRDIDEAALREGRIDNRYYGTLRVPAVTGFVANLKIGGRESEPLAAEEAAAGLVDVIRPNTTYVLGAGSTLLAAKRQLGFAGTLLGVDVWRDGELLVRDADETALLALAARTELAPFVVVISPTAGQASLLGRGNQQLSARFLRLAQPQLAIVATRGKLAQLDGAPLWVDTGDEQLDAALSGLREVIVGFDTRLLYRVVTY